jgi:hypothetical protein
MQHTTPHSLDPHQCLPCLLKGNSLEGPLSNALFSPLLVTAWTVGLDLPVAARAPADGSAGNSSLINTSTTLALSLVNGNNSCDIRSPPNSTQCSGSPPPHKLTPGWQRGWAAGVRREGVLLLLLLLPEAASCWALHGLSPSGACTCHPPASPRYSAALVYNLATGGPNVTVGSVQLQEQQGRATWKRLLLGFQWRRCGLAKMIRDAGKALKRLARSLGAPQHGSTCHVQCTPECIEVCPPSPVPCST